MPAIIGRTTPHSLKKWLGRGAYGLVAAYKFIRFVPFRCIVTVNGQQTSFQAFDVLIASGGYQGGVLVAAKRTPATARSSSAFSRGRPSGRWQKSGHGLR